ncbi:MAG TPA: hypothetical protein PKW55_01465 [Spirochaetota bacterium]|nr:hypothetical protein [Spirochaetota bacterium]HOM38841.1 hypothetical protein [Spirochaetota bacterium]HPQ49136.1 hypothetical protein [Spirochaetota bacterium]
MHLKPIIYYYNRFLRDFNISESVYDIIFIIINEIPIVNYFFVIVSQKYSSAHLNMLLAFITSIFILYFMHNFVNKLDFYKKYFFYFKISTQKIEKLFKIIKALVGISLIIISIIIFSYMGKYVLSYQTNLDKDTIKIIYFIVTLLVLVLGFFLLFIEKNFFYIFGFFSFIIVILLWFSFSFFLAFNIGSLIGGVLGGIAGFLVFFISPVIIVGLGMLLWKIFVKKLFDSINNFIYLMKENKNYNFLKNIVLSILISSIINFYSLIIITTLAGVNKTSFSILFYSGVLPLRIILFLTPPINVLNVIIMLISFIFVFY